MRRETNKQRKKKDRKIQVMVSALPFSGRQLFMQSFFSFPPSMSCWHVTEFCTNKDLFIVSNSGFFIPIILEIRKIPIQYTVFNNP